MGQSPIQFVVERALPLLCPSLLLEIHQPIPHFAQATVEGEEGHRNFKLVPPQPFCRFRSRAYDLFKIHIHTKPEHSIKGKPHSQLELHLVCIPCGGDELDPKVVIGILINIHKDAAFHQGIEDLAKAYEEGIQKIDSKSSSQDVQIPIYPLFPNGDVVNWFHYEGSLTSFPFSEDVSWFVLKTPNEATASNVAQFTQLVQQEARELQPLDRRLVVRSFAVENETMSTLS